MLSWWGRELYLNNKQIKTRGVLIITSEYCSSGSSGSRVRSKTIGHDKYKGKRSILYSKPTPIHGQVHKSDLIFSKSRSHFSWLPHAVPKGLINCLYDKCSYDYIIIYSVINGFSPNEVKIHQYICDDSIITFFIRGFRLGF